MDLLPQLSAKLTEQGLSPKLLKQASFDTTTGTLFLNGQISVSDGSRFNLCLSDFVDEYNEKRGVGPSIRTLSRASLSFKRTNAAKPKPNIKLSVPDEELKQLFDDDPLLQRKIRYLAKEIMHARGELVVYTGAGISTSSGIPDFRGPNGVWTCRDRGLDAPESVEMEEATPTYAHMCLVQWQNDGMMKYLVSQNVDGLHRRSGIRADMISELHGNCYIEICQNCNKEFLRDYDVCNHRGPHFANIEDKWSKSGISHITGRRCDVCMNKGILRDSIIHFTEDLPQQALELGTKNSREAKVGLVIGSSLHVTPAADLPELVRGPLFIINLQQTGRDVEALQKGGLLIHGPCDKVMALLMKELGYDFPYRGSIEAVADSVESKDAEDDQPAEEGSVAKSKPSPKSNSKRFKSASKSTPPKSQPSSQPQSQPMNSEKKTHPPPASAPLYIYIGNRHKQVRLEKGDSNSHSWTMMICLSADGTQCSPEDLSFIQSVEYQLHPTFEPATVEVSQAPFELHRIGWGTFVVGVRVKLHDGNVVEHQHRLSFEQNLTLTQVALPRPSPLSNLLSQVQAFGSNNSNLRHVDTRVTTVTGRTFIEKSKP